jgi:hypothetical protein
MVSPFYKAGYGVNGIEAVAPDDDGVVFSSLGGFAGVLSGSGVGVSMYLAHREPFGWSTVSVQPPFGSVTDFSGNLEYTLANGTLGANAGAEQNSGTVDELLLHNNDAPNTAASWEVAGTMKKLDESPLEAIEQGASADLCHIEVGETAGPLLPEAVNTNNQIYDFARGCDGEPPALRVVALNNSGKVINRSCGVDLGVGTQYSQVGQESNFNSIAAGGNEIFFSTRAESGAQKCSAPIQLFVRLGGVKTLEISKPISEACIEVPCPGAPARADSYFRGASEDGSRVFFTTKAPLSVEDGDAGNDLYMATIGCPGGGQGCSPGDKEVISLVQVSHDAVQGEAAEVQGVVRIAPDGSRVYFVARGALDTGVNMQGAAPVDGMDNLYVYDSTTDKTMFVADLCSGPGLSGVANDASCPRDLSSEANSRGNDTKLWGSGPEAQSAGQEGSFLVFSTYAQLLSSDADNAKDVYLYDAQTGALERVSIGEMGSGSNGNDNDTNGDGSADATIAAGHMGGGAHVNEQEEMATRAIDEDGTRIVFTSAGPLSPDATNGVADIYEWDEGIVSLISSGSAEEADVGPVISSLGQDIFFRTSQGLVSQDTDGAPDVYDARMGGGFPSAPVQRRPCAGDACQGPLSIPAPLLVPGSISQAPGENLAPPVRVAPSKKKITKKVKVKRAKRVKRAPHKSKSGKAAFKGERRR